MALPDNIPTGAVLDKHDITLYYHTPVISWIFEVDALINREYNVSVF